MIEMACGPPNPIPVNPFLFSSASTNLNKCCEQCTSFNSIRGICGLPNAQSDSAFHETTAQFVIIKSVSALSDGADSSDTQSDPIVCVYVV